MMANVETKTAVKKILLDMTPFLDKSREEFYTVVRPVHLDMVE